MKRSSSPPSGKPVPSAESRSLVAVLSRSTKNDTPAQRLFQKLIGKIETAREQVKTWEDYGHRFAQRLAGEVEPLENQLRQKQREMALLIGDILSRRDSNPRTRLRNSDRATLRELLKELLDSLPQADTDEKLAAVRAKHAPSRRRGSEGPEINIEELLKEVEDEMQEGQGDGQHSRSRKKGAADHGTDHRADHSARAEMPAHDPVNPSLRDAYRKLVSILHPDRERDPKERERKNQLMQRVNQAYETQDLLTLLSLQVELTNLDAQQLSSPERLAQYNKVLREQLARLESQVAAMRLVFAPVMGRFVRTLTVKAVDKQLSTEIKRLQAALDELTRDLAIFRDPAQLRARLDDAKQEREQDRYIEQIMLEVEALMEMDINDFEEGPQRKPRRKKRKGGKRRRS